jgi:photosystem II stability/assembly factor-like uncharacterized protein
MRGLAVIGCLVLVDAHVGAEPGPPRWQAASGGVAIARVWGVGNELYGVGSSGAFHSADGGATWQPTDGAGPASGVWGSAIDDVWVVRARTIHHSHDGKNWTTQALPMLSYGAQLEGMWGVDRDRYLFGVDRSDGAPRGVILRSRDGGASWRAEDVPELDRIAGMWGSDAKDVYAVGSRGVVLHSAGDGAWSIVRAASGASLEGIWGASATSIYAVGANGQILHSADRGKTWTRRLSGVTYTLSSIVGSGSEILVGSADGPPLRSTDGVAWRPLSGLIGRGNVWAERDRQVVATSTGVQFLGEPFTDYADEPHTNPSLRAPPGYATMEAPYGLQTTGAEAAAVEALAARYGATYPNARDLLYEAAKRFRSTTIGPRSAARIVTAEAAIRSVNGCGQAHDRKGQPSATGLSFDVWFTCETTCPGSVTAQSVVSRYGSIRTRRTIVWEKTDCKDPEPLFEMMLRSLESDYRMMIDRRLDDALAAATIPQQRLDALAAYVLDGGSRGGTWTQLAALLNRPTSWPGFPWN